MINWLHTKKIYIDFLECALENQKKEETRWANRYSLVLRDRLKRDFRYSDAKLDKAKKSLIKAGHLGESYHQLYVTDDGKKFLKKYGEFLLLPLPQKLGVILKKGMTPIIIFITSILGLPVLIYKLWALF